MASKKLTLVPAATEGGAATATVADATIGDIFTTAISTDQCLTGAYGVAQKIGFVIGGMAIQEYRRSGSANFL